jgi:hypothetical protein
MSGGATPRSLLQKLCTETEDSFAVTTNQINILIPIISLEHPHPTWQDTHEHYYYYYYYSLFLLHISLAGSYESMGLTDQALLIHCSAKNV